jgi:hypothetical protein
MSPAPASLPSLTAAAPAQLDASHPLPDPLPDPSPDSSPDSWTRSAAVDFFRGLGLWIVFIDHIDPNIWSHLTLWRFGFSDFAEIFIFLSGYIGLGSYERALAAGHASGAIRKLGRRIARLYVAHLASLAVSLMVLGAFAERGLRLNLPGMYVWMQDPEKYLLRVLTLRYVPHLFSLLPLYIVVSPILLLAAIGFRRAPKLTLCVSGAFWLATQFPAFDSRIVELAYPDPIAWQFLFVLGAAVRYYSDRLKPFALSRWTIWTSAIIVAGTAALKSFTLFPWTLHWLNEQVHGMLLRDSGKLELAPYRLVHFLALLIVVYSFTHDRRRWLQSLLARLVIACGADSLFIYSCSLVLDVGANLLLVYTHGGAVLQLELSIFGVALLCGLAWRRRANAGQWFSSPIPVSNHIRSSAE